MGAAERARGARAEVAVVNYLRAAGYVDARRYLAGDGRQPGDVDWHPLVCLEVKDVARSCWPTWCRQAAAEARAGLVPAVVRRTRGVPDVGAWECRVHGWRWHEVTGINGAGPFGPDFHKVDGYPWAVTTFAAFVAAVRALDATPSKETP